MKTYIGLVFFTILSTFSFAQNILEVKVVDKETNISLMDATIYNLRSKEVSYTNEFGVAFMSVNVNDSIFISYVGYESMHHQVVAFNNPLQIELNPESMDQVIITADKSKSNRAPVGTHKINIEDIKATSFIAGEPDVLQALQSLPGVSNTREAMAGIVVRGGLPDQNLVILDGVRIYNYSHIFGFVSLFNGDVVKNVELYKGGIHPRYGGKASATINIGLNDGNNPKPNGKFSIGLISSRLYYNYPIIQDKLNLVFGARFSYLDLITIPLKIKYKNGSINGYPNIKLNDITLRSTYKLNERSDLSITLLRTGDRLKSYNRGLNKEEVTSRGWVNNALSLKYKTILKSKAVFRSNITGYDYKYEYSSSAEDKRDQVLSSIRELGASMEYSKFINHHNSFSVGLDNYYTSLEPFSLTVERSDENKELSVKSQNFIELSAFQNWILEDKLYKVNIGMRESFIRDRFFISPRFSAQYNFDKTHLYAAFDRNYQNISQFQPVLLGDPIISWIVYNDVTTSDQYSIGLRKFYNNHITFEAETFYRSINNVPIYNRINNSLYSISGIEKDDFDNGRIKAYGVESTVSISNKKFSSRLSYTFLNSKTHLLNDVFQTDFSRRSEFNFTSQFKLSKKILAGFNLVYKDGQPITLPSNAYINKYGQKKYIFTVRNNGRYPNYLRCDINAEYNISQESAISLSIYNIFNRRNPFHITIENEDTENNTVKSYYKDQILFGILPTFSYTKSF